MAKARKNNLDSFEGMFLGNAETESEKPLDGQTHIDTIAENVPQGSSQQAKETKPKVKAEPKPKKKKGRPKANRETKKRITFTLLQSKYEQANKIAYIEGKSVSEVIGEFLSKYIKKNHDKITEYDNLTDRE